MGYGVRSPIARKNDCPSPDRYRSKSPFDKSDDGSDKNHSNSKLSEKAFGQKVSFCFGNGREIFSKTVVNKDKIYTDATIPGPGSYTDHSKDLGKNALKYSLGPRNFYLDTTRDALRKGVPGPGYYKDQTALDPIGRYNTSNHV